MAFYSWQESCEDGINGLKKMVYCKTKATTARMEARRRSILDAATKLFGENGYHATTVPMIVAESQSSTGSFYHYFHNKEDVFAEVLVEVGKEIREVVLEAKATETDPLCQILSAIKALFLHLAENPRIARILLVETSGLSPRLEQVERQNIAQQAHLVRDVLESAPEAFYTENSAIAARCLVGGVCEALRAWMEGNPENRLSAAEMAHVVGDFSTRAVRRS
jgi:AcrR family transcriptional regulator